MDITRQHIVVHKTLGLHGQAMPPGSKSQTIRALFFALLAKGNSVLQNVLESDDSKQAKKICEQLGATFQVSDNELKIHSQGLPIQVHSTQIDSGNSGITTRFLLPLLGLLDSPSQTIMVDCGEQMRARPIQPLIEALIQLGMDIRYLKEKGKLPVVVRGRLKGGAVTVSGITSQYLSALLIALPCAEGQSVITVTDLHERPYVEMTLQWLKQQHVAYRHERVTGSDIFYVSGNHRYQPFQTTMPGDFSSASYLIAAAALLPGNIELNGLDPQDPQGDKQLVSILQAMGADMYWDASRLMIHGGKSLSGITIDANDIPDLVPTLAVIGTQAQGKTEITNVKQARLKETDRLHSMTDGLRRLGARVEEHADGLTIYQSQLHGSEVKGYGDHRTVMALCIAGLCAEGKTVVDEAEAINKTFPDFLAVMRSLGANMEVQHASL